MAESVRKIVDFHYLLLASVRALRRLVFKLRSLGPVTYGSGFVVGARSAVSRGASLHAGRRVSIGSNLSCQVHLTIHDDVMISSNVAFIGDDHAFGDVNSRITTQGLNPKSRCVLMGDNLIGFGSIILGNVIIGAGTIVGAGSLVTKDLPPNTVCVGRPAKPVRSRYQDV